MQLLPILKGVATWVPVLYDPKRHGTGGTVSARYCYSVWLRHLALLEACGLPTHYESVAELGPGDSLGISLAALLTGSNRVDTLDVVRYANTPHNLEVLAQLARMLGAREPIPDERELPLVYPRLRSYAFPDFLDERRLEAALQEQRVQRIAAAVSGASSDVSVTYYVPWQECWKPDAGGADLLISQAALEHVEDVEGVQRSLAAGLRIGGIASHVIDFKSHGMTPTWDGHLEYGDALWKVVKGHRPFLLNRRSPSEHLQAMRRSGFEIIRTERVTASPTIPRAHLNPAFRDRSEEDRSTTDMVVVARRVR